MSSKAQQICDAVIALMQTPALTGIGAAGVQDDPDYGFEIRDLPFVAVYLGDETQPDRAARINGDDHSLTVTVRVTAKKGGVTGKTALASCDPLHVATYGRLMNTDLTLGGLALDIIPGQIRRVRDVIESPVAYVETDYSVGYRTSMISLEN